MSDKIFIGRRLASLDFSQEFLPISKVVINRDDDTWFESGDDTGRTLEFTNPWATQEMADFVLSESKNFVYKPFFGQDAVYPITAEIGDAVTIGNKYSLLATSEIDYNALTIADISAPEDEELDHEYPFETRQQRESERQNKRIYSAITKTDEEIRLFVTDEINNLSSSFDVQIDSITSTVQGQAGQISTLQQTSTSLQSQITDANGNISSIEQKVNSITLEVSNASTYSRIGLTVDGIEVSSATVRFTGDVVFATDLTDGVTTISGDNIQTGEILADYIKLGGKMEVYHSTGTNTSGGYVGYMSGMTASGSSTAGIAITDSTESAVMICTSSGARMGYDGVSTVVCTSTQVSIRGDVVYINGEAQSASDQRLKTQVQEDLDRYMPVFDKLRPVTFVYDGHKRRHMGFIAQEIQQTLAEEGIPESDFAALCTEVPNEERPMGMYSLRYGELQIMTVAKVQDLEKRLKILEAQNG